VEPPELDSLEALEASLDELAAAEEDELAAALLDDGAELAAAEDDGAAAEEVGGALVVLLFAELLELEQAVAPRARMLRAATPVMTLRSMKTSRGESAGADG
jgi:hypothetical protein